MSSGRFGGNMRVAARFVVVAMLAFGAYTFVQLMNAEARAAQAYGRQVQARAAADSGVQFAAVAVASASRRSRERSAT